jgi:hypothetical protein
MSFVANAQEGLAEGLAEGSEVGMRGVGAGNLSIPYLRVVMKVYQSAACSRERKYLMSRARLMCFILTTKPAAGCSVRTKAALTESGFLSAHVDPT